MKKKKLNNIDPLLIKPNISEINKQNNASQRYYTVIISILLLVGTMLVFWPVINCDFVHLDDNEYVHDNPRIQSISILKGIEWAFTTGYCHMWQPITWLSYMYDARIYGMKPGGFHFTNLLLHTANVLLVFILFFRMTGNYWRSGMVAVLFAIHPLRVETVAWVADRKDVLSSFFMLTALWIYLRYVKHPSLKLYILLSLTFSLSLMSKPMVVTFPFLLLFIDYWPLHRFSSDLNSDRLLTRFRIKLIIEKIPLFILSLSSSLITYFVQSETGALDNLNHLSLKTRFFNTLVSYVTYLGKAIYPRWLAIPYIHPENTLPIWAVIGSALILFLVTILVIQNAKQKPYFIVGWMWYLVSLVPASGIIQTGFHAMADRFTYLPLIGIFIMVVWGVSDILSRLSPPLSPKYLVIPIGAIILIFCVCTRSQIAHWKNSETLFSHTLKIFPNNYISHHYLADFLEGEGRLNEATDHCHKALQIEPKYVFVRNTIGIILAKQGKYDESLAQFKEVIRAKPQFRFSYYNLGVALVEKKEWDQAITCFTHAIKIFPGYTKARFNLSLVLYIQGRYTEALKEYQLYEKYGGMPQPYFFKQLIDKVHTIK